MAAKGPSYAGKIYALVFTSIVAPLVVEMTAKALNGENLPPASREQRTSQNKENPGPGHSYPVPPVPPPFDARSWSGRESLPVNSAETTQIIVKGVGKSPQEALHDALRAALARALASHVEDAVWATHGQVILEDALRNNAGLILGWKELGASRQWRLAGTLHHKELAVEINRQALKHRLRSLHLVG